MMTGNGKSADWLAIAPTAENRHDHSTDSTGTVPGTSILKTAYETERQGAPGNIEIMLTIT
jgi:hypothetical protein